jgi:iron-sulfur cluster assembly protein
MRLATAVFLIQKRTRFNLDVLVRSFSSLPAAGRVRISDEKGSSTTTPVTSRLARKSALTVTPEAAKRLLELQMGHSEPVWGIRVGVKTRGCNGVSYTMNWANEKGKNDEVVTIQVPSVDQSGSMSTVRILIEPAALLKIAGTVMDFHTSDIVTEFVFTNPNAKGTCGCGESFNT